VDVDLVRRVTREIARLRKERMTQEALAELLDVPVQHVSRIEAGQNITLQTLERLAVALGLRVSVTFEPGDKPRKPPPTLRQKLHEKRQARTKGRRER
jgi:transcriptional regulator with XRE-family HTH domain